MSRLSCSTPLYVIQDWLLSLTIQKYPHQLQSDSHVLSQILGYKVYASPRRYAPWHIEIETWHFIDGVIECRFVNERGSTSKFSEVCSLETKWHWISIGSGDSLERRRWTIPFTKDDRVHWFTCTSFCRVDVLTEMVICGYGPLTRSAKLRVAHASGRFFSRPRVSDPHMHHGTYVTHVPRCMPGSLSCGLLWSELQGKHSRRMCDSQFSVSDSRPMGMLLICSPSDTLKWQVI